MATRCVTVLFAIGVQIFVILQLFIVCVEEVVIAVLHDKVVIYVFLHRD